MQTPSNLPTPGLPDGAGDAEARHLALLNGVLHGVVFLDAKGRIRTANQAAERILGLSLAQLQDRDTFDPRWQPIHEDGSPFPGEGHPVTVALRTGQAVEDVVMGVFNPQLTETRWIRVSAAPLFRQGEAHPSQVMATFVDITDQRQLEAAQVFLAKAEWLGNGEDFFEALARFLAGHLGVDYVCIDRLLGEGLEAETLAIWVDGHFDENVRYALRDTPCGDVVGKQVCCFPQGVRHQFPKDQVLQDLGAESYLGITLWGSQGQPIGLIALIGRRPIRHSTLAQSILALVGVRAAGELERRDAEESLRRSQAEAQELGARLHAVLESPQGMVVFALDAAYRYTAFTQAHQEVMRAIWGVEIALGMNMLEAIQDPVDRVKAKGNFDRTLAGEALILVEDYGTPPNRTFYEDRYSPLRDATGEVIGLSVFVIDITERQRANEALHEALRFNEQVLASAQEGAIVYDHQLHYRVWNPFMERLSGYPAEEVLGKHPSDLFSFLLDAGVIQRLERVLAGEAVTPIEFPFRVARTGKVGWARDLSAPLRNAQGEIIGVIGLVHDITLTKELEEQALASMRFLRETQAIAALGSYRADFQKGRWESSEILDGIFGIDADFDRSIAGWLSLVHPDDQAGMAEYLNQQVLGGGQRFDREYRILRHGDGALRWVHGLGRLEFDEAGTPVALIGTIQDITERKRMDEAVLESEALLSHYLRHAPIYTYIKEVSATESRVIQASENFQEMIGIPGSQMAGKTMSELFPPEFAAKITADDWAVVTQGKVIQLDEDLGDRNYTTIKFPITQGGRTLLAGYTIDITERKQAELSLRESEARNQALIHAIPDLIFTNRRDGEYLSVQASNPGMLLLPVDAILNRKPQELLPPELADRFLQAFEEALDQQRMCELNYPLVIGGQERHFEARVVPSGGETTLTLIRDVTEARRSEDALRESEERFRGLFQDVESVAVQSYGPDGVTHYWNKASEKLYGYSAEEAVGQNLVELIIPPEMREMVAADMRQMAETGQPIPASELLLRRKDGSRVAVFSSHTIIQAPGRPPELFCIDIDLTAHKQASRDLERQEAELRRQNHLFSALLEILPVGVFMVEAPSGRPLVANDEAMKLLGRGILPDATRDNLSEVYKVYKLGTGAPYPLEDMPILRAMDGEVTRVEDMVIERPDGSRSQLEVFGSPVRDDQGHTWASLASFFDITERKHAEATLREREELLRLSLQGADLGTWDWDVTSGQVTVNERWSEMLGYAPGELDSHMRRFDARVHPDDLDGAQAALEHHFRDETPAYESTHRLRHKDGHWVWVLDRGRVILRDEAGAPLRMCGTHLDITESRWQAILEAARLRLIEFSLSHTLDELLQATIDEACALTASPIGFFHFVDEGEKTISLRAWSTRTLREFCTAEGFGTHYPLEKAGVWADCLRQRKPIIHNDYAALTDRKGLPTGHAAVLRELVVPLFRGERIVALIGVGNNPDPYVDQDIRLVERLADRAWLILERKHAEEQQRQLQVQLLQAQKMESLGILAGGVAHDMNNVLGAILGLASANLETQPEGSATHRAFDTIARAAQRGGAMVRSLLSFARQSPAEVQELDLNALLREEVHLLERTTLAKVQLALNLASDLKPMQGDAGALTHVLMNLCVNAVDAMPDGGSLTLRTRNLEGGKIELQVEDTGTGMSPSVLSKAMDPFFTTKGVGKGTGLGLSMVYSTVKAHQGELELQSEPGRGTRVILRFPACVPAPTVDAPPPVATSAEVLTGLRVLLVDDDDLIQSSLLALLEALGHEAHGVSSGEAALAKFETGFRPDVVILDMNMPGIGGAGTLPKLRALDAEVPVLLATGRADQTALDLVEAHPRVTLLAKPFSMTELKHHLQALRPGLGGSPS